MKSKIKYRNQIEIFNEGSKTDNSSINSINKSKKDTSKSIGENNNCKYFLIIILISIAIAGVSAFCIYLLRKPDPLPSIKNK